MVDDVGGVVGLEDLAREGVGALRSGARVVEGGVPPLVRGVHVTAFRQQQVWKKSRVWGQETDLKKEKRKLVNRQQRQRPGN